MTQLKFICNQNAEKNGAWVIGAASYTSFHKIRIDSYMENTFSHCDKGAILLSCNITIHVSLP